MVELFTMILCALALLSRNVRGQTSQIGFLYLSPYCLRHFTTFLAGGGGILSHTPENNAKIIYWFELIKYK